MHSDVAVRVREAGGDCSADAARRHRYAVASVAVIAAAALSGCSGTRTSATDTNQGRAAATSGAVTTRPTRSSMVPSVSTSRSSPGSSPNGRWHVVVRHAPWRLPYPVSRAVATTSGGKILLAGGLNPLGASRGSVLWIRPSSGRVVRSGRLPVATHDSAGWAARGGLVVAGGANISSVATVEQVLPSGAARVVGSLPRPRSDSVAASVGTTAYIVGGYDGAVLDPVVLSSSNSAATFHHAARLPVPVRYPAVTSTGTTLWVVGGETTQGLTNVVQRVDTVSGEAHIVGRLPRSLDAATAEAIGNKLIIFGGATPEGTTSAILTCATPTLRCKLTGHLPFAVQNAAVATVAGQTYLLGGERDGAVLDRVVTIDYTQSCASRPNCP